MTERELEIFEFIRKERHPVQLTQEAWEERLRRKIPEWLQIVSEAAKRETPGRVLEPAYIVALAAHRARREASI